MLKHLLRIAALLCLALPAFAQSTVAVSGHAQILDSSAPLNTSVRFELIGCSNGQARVDGVAVFADNKKDFQVNPATGIFTGALYPNASIDCNGSLGTTKYNVTFVYPDERFNSKTVCYVVGPGAFVLETAQPCVTSPAIVTANAVITNPQGSQQVTQPPGTVLGVNFLQATSTLGAPISTPSSSSATCIAGQLWSDANFVYICTATNTIKRAALASF
jgi:hypothetical protein